MASFTVLRTRVRPVVDGVVEVAEAGVEPRRLPVTGEEEPVAEAEAVLFCRFLLRLVGVVMESADFLSSLRGVRLVLPVVEAPFAALFCEFPVLFCTFLLTLLPDVAAGSSLEWSCVAVRLKRVDDVTSGDLEI